MKRALPFLLSFLLAAFFAWHAQPSTQWRDGGEFILAGVYLDIPHPAGFPLYAQLANIFTFLPIGPLAFRVHLLSAVIAGSFSFLLFSFLQHILKVFLPGRDTLSMLLALLTSLIPFFTETIVKQSLTAEVYLLNGACIIGLLLLQAKFEETRDRRWLILLGFGAGLTLCNHVASILIILPAAIFITIRHPAAVRNVAFPALIISLLALALYLYLPVRALAHPPLNTGDPSSITRFWNQISDGRDRALRGGDLSKTDKAPVAAPQWNKGWNSFVSDISRLKNTMSFALIAAATVGSIIGLNFAPTLVGLSLTTFFGGWYFFQGWDPDPWVPLYISLAVGTAFVAPLPARVIKSKSIGAGISVLIVLVLLASIFDTRAIALAQFLKTSENAASASKPLLAAAPPNAPLLCEQSWFFLKYLRDVEGYREDVALLYQPAIFFPDYFAPVSVQQWQTDMNGGEKALGSFLSSRPRQSIISLEPSALSNQFVSVIAQYQEAGAVELKVGENGKLDPQFSAAVIERLAPLGNSESFPNSVFGDARHYQEISLNGIADLLSRSGHPEIAAAIMQKLCSTEVDKHGCSEETLNNMALALLDSGEPAAAISIFEALLGRAPKNRSAIEQNLKIARESLLHSAEK